MSEEKSKYLDFLQAAIGRMGANSFVCKGWSVALATAILAMAAKDTNPKFAAVGFVPVLLFWCLDGYYLGLERRFREMYDAARVLDSGQAVSFDLTPGSFTFALWVPTLYQPAVALVHFPMFVVMGILTIIGYRR